MSTTIYTLKEFAEKLKVSTRTLVRWHESNKFTAKINPSGKMFYTEEDFKTYIGGVDTLMIDSESLQVFIELAKEDIAEGKVSSLEGFRERMLKRT